MSRLLSNNSSLKEQVDKHRIEVHCLILGGGVVLHSAKSREPFKPGLFDIARVL